jgi:hypothetical protein
MFNTSPSSAEGFESLNWTSGDENHPRPPKTRKGNNRKHAPARKNVAAKVNMRAVAPRSIAYTVCVQVSIEAVNRPFQCYMPIDAAIKYVSRPCRAPYIVRGAQVGRMSFRTIYVPQRQNIEHITGDRPFPNKQRHTVPLPGNC